MIGGQSTSRRNLLLVGVALAGVPLVWFFYLLAGYLATPFACEAGAPAWLYVISALALAAAAASTAVAFVLHRSGRSEDDGPSPLAIWAVGSAAIFGFAILLASLAVGILDPCSPPA